MSPSGTHNFWTRSYIFGTNGFIYVFLLCFIKKVSKASYYIALYVLNKMILCNDAIYFYKIGSTNRLCLIHAAYFVN